MVCHNAHQGQQEHEGKARSPKSDRGPSRIAGPNVQEVGLCEVAAAAP